MAHYKNDNRNDSTNISEHKNKNEHKNINEHTNVSEHRNYEEIFNKVMDYEQALHEKNRKRIRIGLKCIWIIPLFFLMLLFFTGSNKVVFLILWIVSLFVISVYLIVVEYLDYNLQEKIMELKGEEGEIQAVTPDDLGKATRIIKDTRERIGQGLNARAETDEADQTQD